MYLKLFNITVIAPLELRMVDPGWPHAVIEYWSTDDYTWQTIVLAAPCRLELVPWLN
jgi:hypothetical protein